MACPTYLKEFDSSVPDPEIRLAGESVNARLLERLLRHRHFLLMVENGLVRDLAGPLRDVKRQVTDQLSTVAAQTGAETVNEVTRRHLERLRRAIDEALATARRAQLSLAGEKLRALTERELEIQNRALREMIPDGVHPFVNFAGPDMVRADAILSEPLGGKVWSERMRRNFGELALQMRRDLAASAALGESIPEAGRRLRRSVEKLGIRRSTLIARTEIQRVANSTADKLYRANQAVIKGVTWVATLDDRACLRCAPLDGEMWEVSDNSRPIPVSDTHPACRCFLSPVTRSFREMGIDADDFGPSTRASMDGQVPDTVTYRDWFKTQDEAFQRRVLGPSRFELFRSGEVDIDGFTRRQTILSLDELPAVEATP